MKIFYLLLDKEFENYDWSAVYHKKNLLISVDYIEHT